MANYKTCIPEAKFPAVLAGAVLACLVFLNPLPCFCQQGAGAMFDPGGGEIRITSDRMIMQTGGNAVEFTGNVRAVQDETTVRSKQLKIFYKSGAVSDQDAGMDEDAIERIDAAGDVIINFEDTTARADKAVYTAGDGLLKLYGLPACLEKKESVITGRQITMNRNTGEVVVDGNNQGRVEAVFKPAAGSGRNESERPDSGRTDMK